MRKEFFSFVAGAAVGVTATIAAGVYLNSEHGRKTKENIKKVGADFYSFVKPRLESIKEFGKEEYRRVVTSAAEEYGRIKNLSKDAVRDIIDRTLILWDDVAAGK